MTAIGAHVTRGHRRYARDLEFATLLEQHRSAALEQDLEVPVLERSPRARRRAATLPPMPDGLTRADHRAAVREQRRQLEAQLEQHRAALLEQQPARELSDEEIVKRATKAALREERKRDLQARRDIALGDGFRSLGKRKRWYDQHGPRRAADEVM